MKTLPKGVDNFKDLIINDCYYVDKTAIIEELLTKQKLGTVLFPRPRRFGKSLFISMLENFFDIDKKDTNRNLFDGLYISKSEIYEDNLNRYPVINLDFKDLKSETYKETFNDIKEILSKLYRSKKYILEILDENETLKFNRVLNEQGEVGDYKNSLLNLSEWLSRYYNEQVVILIDEYDTPIEAGRTFGYYKEILDLIKPLFSTALKGNDSLKMGILTGVLRLGGESLFSSFNNLKVYDIMTPGYNEYFGFTESETKDLLEYYDLKLTKDVKEYYDGYNFGGINIYNPWSIINYASDKMLIPYWANTASNSLIKNLLSDLDEEEKMEIESLILGNSISFEYNAKLSYNSLMSGLGYNSLLNLLLVSGYLTFDKEEDEKTYYRIPNKEVKKDFGNMLEFILFDGEAKGRRDLERFIEGLKKNDIVLAEENLNKMSTSVSYHDNREFFYHGYLLGLFNSFISDINYTVTSNGESGFGRSDILIRKKDKTLGIVIELKASKKVKDMERDAHLAKEQMDRMNYRETFEKECIKNIYEYAIVFHGRKAIIR